MFVRLLILIGIIYVCQCRRHHRHPKHEFSFNEIFENIYEDTKHMDKRINYLSKYENNVAFDRVEDNWYSRKLFIKGYNEDKISIKIRHRVMSTEVENIYADRESFKDIKILPVNLDTEKAFYEVKESKLHIYIPYLEQGEDCCTIEINEHIITVPKDNLMSNEVDGDDSSNHNNNYVAENANNANSGNEIDNMPEITCAVMIKPKQTIEINEDNLREIFGELLNEK